MCTACSQSRRASTSATPCAGSSRHCAPARKTRRPSRCSCIAGLWANRFFAKAARHQAVVADLSGAQHAQAQQIGRVGRAQLPARRKRQHQPVQAGGRHGGQLFRKLLGRQRFSLPHHRIAKGIAARHIGDEDGARLDDAVAVHDARRDMHIFQARLVYAAQIQRVRAQGNPRRHALRGLGRKRKGKVAGGFAQRLRGDFRFPVAGRKRARRFAVDADFPRPRTPRAHKNTRSASSASG